jgi:acetyl esterase
LVFNINYRLAPRDPFPAAVEDCGDALAFVVERAAAYGGDLSRLILAGESAGGNLAMTLALMCCVERPEPFAQKVFSLGVVPRAVSAMCGLHQVSDVARFARRRPVSTFTFDRVQEVSEGYIGHTAPGAHDLADPLVLLESAPTFARPFPAVFASVGTRDPLLDDTRRLHTALVHLGVSSEIAYYPGEMHAFQAMIFRRQARQFWRHNYDFLSRHGAGPTREAPPLAQVVFGTRARDRAAETKGF